jgi:group I intron endonuclease
MGVIYKITSPSGKSYIGQTKRRFERRWTEHCKLNGTCILLENAIAKYGVEKMQIEILLEANNSLLDSYEQQFIELLGTLEPTGYNIRSGGSFGNHSEESRDRMSRSKLGTLNHNFGKARSESTKLAISKAKSGCKHHFFGKELSYNHKLNLSKAHKTSDLPMYLVRLKARPKSYQSEGYAVINHPKLKTKYFTSKKQSMEEKYILALAYIQSA